MDRHILVVTLLALTLAGCTRAPAEPGGPPAEGGEEPALAAFSAPVDHAGCTGVELFLPVSEAEAAPYLPAGFTLADPGLAILAAYTCPSGARAFLALGVEPPPALVSQRTNHFWAPDHLLAPNTTFADAFLQARANVTWAEIDVDADVTSTRFSVLAGDTAYIFEGSTAAVDGSDAVAPLLPTFREYAAAHDGVAYVDAGFDGGGGAFAATRGTLTTAGGGAGAALFGPTSQADGLMATDYEYAGARIGFVPWP